MTQTIPTSFTLGGFNIKSHTYKSLCLEISRRLDQRRKTALLFANTNFILKCSPLKSWVNSERVILVNDGVGLDIAAYIRSRFKFPENLNGTDFCPFLLSQLPLGSRIFLYGGKPGVAEKAALEIQRKFGHSVVGTCDGYSSIDTSTLLSKIALSSADIILIAKGNPLQEIWISENMELISATLFLGVGALFDFMAGEVVRAPILLQRLRLEWLFRLYQEPRRLLRRYTIDFVQFLWVCLRA